MAAHRNPKDSMKSTWRTSDKSEWTIFHHHYDFLGLHLTDLDRNAPVHAKTDKIPYMSEWQTNRWVLFHASWPLIIHESLKYMLGHNLGPFSVGVLYTMCFMAVGIHQCNAMRKLGRIVGFLDGDKHERDGVPDHSVVKVILSLLATVSLRIAMAVVLCYDVNLSPMQTNWKYFPIELALYGVVLDFWFYWYHRLMHDNDSLWHLHRTHHLTKHPNPLLTLYADEVQESIDILGIPLLTILSLKLLGLPMGFYEVWICYQYVVFAELMGHSGLRIHMTPPSPVSQLLIYFDCDLVTEDHDLHHRTGWKSSHNYGKQTRLWDRIFGTCTDRIESAQPNIDYNERIVLPIM